MAIVKPFPALRPQPALAARICELPYDVLSSAEARALAKDNPLSFFHVSKPEVDLDPSVGIYDEQVYAQGRNSFQSLIERRALLPDTQPNFYLYRQVMGRHTQVGLVAVTSCDEYLRGVIRKHEHTRPDKEDDRVRHIQALDAQTGPAFLVYPADADLDRVFQQKAAEPPEVDFVAADGIRHSSWTIRDPAGHEMIEAKFARIPLLYIADGHHRSAAAARVFQARGGAGPSGYFLSVIFPDDQMQILPYHRVVHDLNGASASELLARLEKVCPVNQTGRNQPQSRHEVSLFLDGAWYTLTFPPDLTAAEKGPERLDVALLQKHVLGPLLGIDDPRRSDRISFVGGIRGPGELERLVRGAEAACAFCMFPTSMGELMAIAQGGGIMPPKSTWFEPKLRDGMFCHLLA